MAELQELVQELDDNFEACCRDCKKRSADQSQLIDDLTGDITRVEKNLNDTRDIVLSRLEELVRGINKDNAKLTKAIRILDSRVNILKDASNQHAKVLAAKFPEIKCVHMDESGDIAPERGKTGPN